MGVVVNEEAWIDGAVARLQALAGKPFPDVAVLLGSGWGKAMEAVQIDAQAPYGEFPGFLEPAVTGHQGRLVVGALSGRKLLCFRGRCHTYEGRSWREIVRPVRAFAAAGGRIVLLTNAAGGVRDDLRPGVLMILDDHINLTGDNPLRGPVEDERRRFVDMSEAYDAELRRILDEAAETVGAPHAHGVYAAVSGPSYETPAEVRMLRTLGADAVGMSTVGEAIAARACGLRVAAVSCITNRAAGTGPGALTHADVLDELDRASRSLGKVVSEFVRRLPS
jgi:purine nucleotide phosphorylase